MLFSLYYDFLTPVSGLEPTNQLIMVIGSAVSGLVYLIVFVSRSSLRTAAEKTSTSAPSAAAASS